MKTKSMSPAKIPLLADPLDAYGTGFKLVPDALLKPSNHFWYAECGVLGRVDGAHV